MFRAVVQHKAMQQNRIELKHAEIIIIIIIIVIFIAPSVVSRGLKTKG